MPMPSPKTVSSNDEQKDDEQLAWVIKTARALACDESEEALEEKLRAVLGSNQSTDAQVLDALNSGLQIGWMRAARSREAIAESKATIAKADKLTKWGSLAVNVPFLKSSDTKKHVDPRLIGGPNDEQSARSRESSRTLRCPHSA